MDLAPPGDAGDARRCFVRRHSSHDALCSGLRFGYPGGAFGLSDASGLGGGFRPYEKIILAALWIMPLLARSWGGYYIPVTPPLLIALMGLCLSRAQRA